MRLSKKAKKGLNDTVLKVLSGLATGLNPEAALKNAGIEGLEDTFWFLAYVQENENKLYKRLTK